MSFSVFATVGSAVTSGTALKSGRLLGTLKFVQAHHFLVDVEIGEIPTRSLAERRLDSEGRQASKPAQQQASPNPTRLLRRHIRMRPLCQSTVLVDLSHDCRIGQVCAIDAEQHENHTFVRIELYFRTDLLCALASRTGIYAVTPS